MKMRILIADDDRTLVHMLGSEFGKRGWDVVRAFDAMQAVMFANRKPQPDAVILDLGMPGGTGYGVLEKFSRGASTSAIPVIVISGIDDDEAAARALEKGAVRFLRKPVEPDALIQEVEAVVGGSPE